MNTKRPSTFSARRRRTQGGSALVIALMVILALTGLGIVGMKHASQEMVSSANRRNRVQASQVGDAVLRIGVEKFADTGPATHDYLMRWHEKRRAKFGRDTPWAPFQFAGSTDHDGNDAKTFGSREHRHRSFETQQGTDATYAMSIVNRPATSLRRPRGEALNGGKCFWEYTFTATATVGEITNQRERRIRQVQPGATSRGLATGLTGPMSCPDVSGN